MTDATGQQPQFEGLMLPLAALDGFDQVVQLLSPDLRVQWVNQAGLQALGRPLKEVLGQPCHGMWLELPGEQNCPAKAALTEKRVYESEHRSSDGGRWMVRAWPVLGAEGEVVGVLQSVVNLTQKKQLEEDRRRLASVLEQATESVMLTNTAGEIVYVNHGFEELSEYRAAEVMAQKPRLIQSGQHSKDFYRDLWDTINQGDVWRGTFINKAKSGRLYQLEASVWPLRDDSGRITHFACVGRDVTHEVELEAHLRQAQKMEAIGTLAGGIAHDFNNILSAILGYAALGKEDSHGFSAISQHFEEIEQAGKRASDLVRQILAFSRQTEQDSRPLRVQSVVKESAKLLRGSLPSTIQIETDVESGAPPILADPTQIHQVLMNLCTNAFHAIGDNPGVLRVELTTRQLNDQEASPLQISPGEYVRLMVSDTGAGIPVDVQDRIFDPYFTTKGPSEGTGLGLATVHGIVRSHAGAIRVESSMGEGTLFEVFWPTCDPDAWLEKQPKENGPPTRGTENLLFVDDEAPIVQFSKLGLERLGYTVNDFISSKQALEEFRQSPDAYDLIITDLTMPEMSGFEMAREMLATRPDLPIILCTGYSEKVSPELVEDAGLADLALKPVITQELAGRIRKILDKTR